VTACFGDTSYFLALLIPGDAKHAAANAWAARSRQPIVTSEFVVLEVGNFLSAQHTRWLFARLLQALHSDARLNVIAASTELVRRGCDLYVSRRDKAWSLTDCISMEIMFERGLTEALTADHHFEQAGFKALLK